MTICPRAALLLSLTLLAGCSQEQSTSADDARQVILPEEGQFGGPVVASIDGRPIADDLLLAFLRMRGQINANPEQRERALRDLIDLVLLAREARDGGVLQRDSVQAELTVQRISSIANLSLRELPPVTDEEIQAVYESQLDRTGHEEYRLRHLLAPEQDAAQALIDRLAAGESFAAMEQELAQQQGPSAAGELGWVTLSHVPGSFAAALSELQPGEYTDAPVQSEYGWHVVLLEDQRAFSPPPLAEVADGIRSTLTRQKLEQHVERLRSNARIDVEIAPVTGEHPG